MTLTSYVRAVIVVALVDGVGIALGAAVLDVPLVLPPEVLVFLAGVLLAGVVGALFAVPVVAVVKPLAAGAVDPREDEAEPARTDPPRAGPPRRRPA